jgi:nucleoside-diphosphate-sugar epimerase
MARLSSSATASGTKVEKKEVSADPSSAVSIVYRFDAIALRPEPPHDRPRTRRPLAHCTPGEPHKNSEIDVKVLVTGGTGFVGSHAVAALLRGGHRVRLLVRDPSKIQRVFEAREIEVDDYTIGDMADAQAVRTALTGCDAVLHAAATLYGGKEICSANVRGARNVLGMGCELGLDPILFISTVVAMFPPAGERITVDDPICGLETTYGRSKVEGERFARELQARGAPLVSIYPAGVFGPDDPSLGEPTKGLRAGIRFGWPITAGGISIVDVRDLAEIIAATLEPGRGPRRFMAGGHFANWSELADLCDELTGRRAPRFPMPAPLLRGIGWLLDIARKIAPFTYPITHEAAKMMDRLVPCDSRATVEQLGIQFRPMAETLRDTIRWLYETGEISAKIAGQIANDRASQTELNGPRHRKANP